METLLGRHWHHLPAEEVAQLLDVDRDRGLDLFEVKHRRARLGPNEISPPPRRGAAVRFLLQLKDPLVVILVAAAGLKLVFGGFADAAVIVAVVLLNAAIGYAQEAKAERAIEALAVGLVADATVLRAGETRRVPAKDLVAGDVVLLAAGDRVPADLRLVAARGLRTAEAALTGESTAADKDGEARLVPDTPLADRANMAYASTLVVAGAGKGLVVAVGGGTEIGRISGLLASTSGLETPLTRKMAALGGRLLAAILVVAAATAALGLIRGDSFDDVLSAAIALAVGAVPEGLPAAITVGLAIGVARMARRKAIIRNLPAVETIGGATVICSDKTGTLTRNEMTVSRVFADRSWYDVSGGGYEPRGAFVRGDSPARADEDPALAECLRAGALCNDSALAFDEGRWTPHGDPTEVALLVAARKAGLDPADCRARFPRIDAIPFDSSRQYMATLHATAHGGRVVYVKGAPEVVLERCVAALDGRGGASPLDVAAARREAERAAADGARVLAFARASAPDGAAHLEDSLPGGLVFLGLQGMIDPPRDEAVAAVGVCLRAGIAVKMITGDHAATAVAVGRRLGLASGAEPRALAGRDLAALSDSRLIDAAAGAEVFARVSPEQKLRLVEALQARGEIVAMTGDGVNDAPALKQADIGIAMGIAGTEVAKEAADMVLADDNFASIEAAVEEGRHVRDNLSKIIAWALPANLGQGLIVVLAAILGVAPPILPLQILWINMTTGGVLGLCLAVEPPENDLMLRRPRDPRAPLLDRRLVAQVAFAGLLVLVCAFGLFRWELARGADVALSRTVALNAVAVFQTFHLLNCRSLRPSLFSAGLFRNRWLWAGIGGALSLQIALTHAPLFNALFRTVPLGAAEWARIAGAAALAASLIEAGKWIVGRTMAEGGSNARTDRGPSSGACAASETGRR